jgi:threonine dehydrogenase-like Zn-dependent dehydrogenase
VRPRGTIVVKSTFHGLGKLDISNMVVNEITIIGSRCGPFEPALRILAQKRLDTLSLIDKKFPIEQAKDAFDYARGKLKVLFAF